MPICVGCNKLFLLQPNTGEIGGTWSFRSVILEDKVWTCEACTPQHARTVKTAAPCRDCDALREEVERLRSINHLRYMWLQNAGYCTDCGNVAHKGNCPAEFSYSKQHLEYLRNLVEELKKEK